MMGHYADRFSEKLKRENQKYFLNTAADEPFASKWRIANISDRKCYITYQNSCSPMVIWIYFCFYLCSLETKSIYQTVWCKENKGGHKPGFL